MSACARCGAALTADEIAITRKLINRGTDTFYCAGCLADHFQVTRAEIEERIDYFRQMGCTLFAQGGNEVGE